MNRSRRSQNIRRRVRARGVAIEEFLSTLSLIALVGTPIAAAARYVGPELAGDLDQRVHAVSVQDPNAISPLSTLGDGLDFGRPSGASQGSSGRSQSVPTPQLTTGSAGIAETPTGVVER